MAVIVRSPGSLTSAVRRAFAQVSIPVAGELEALATNESIAPFLLLAEIAIKAKPLNTENVERLLLSEFGGADAISLRRIRRALLASRTDDDKRTDNQSSELICYSLKRALSLRNLAHAVKIYSGPFGITHKQVMEQN
jgi:hypothetical protein